jgi:hypothetical protein
LRLQLQEDEFPVDEHAVLLRGEIWLAGIFGLALDFGLS